MSSTVTLADFDLPTRSASGMMLRYIVPRAGPATLYALLARRSLVSLILPTSDFILGMGHGEKALFTGQNESQIWKVGEYDPKEVQGKIIKLLSCQTALELGPDMIRNGARAFLGYTEDFVWIMDAEKVATPWADPYARRGLQPVVDSLNALLDGKTVKEAFDIEIAGYEKNISVEEDSLVKSTMIFDMRGAIFLGDGEARVNVRPHFTLPIPPPPNLIPIST